jgi:hypothetical protein
MRSTIRRQFLIVAIVVSFATSIGVAVNLHNGREPSEDLLRLYQYISLLLIIVWLIADPALPVDQRPSFDHFMLTWMTFPLLALYHQFVCHRWKGIARVLGLMLLILAPYLTWIILYAAS